MSTSQEQSIDADGEQGGLGQEQGNESTEQTKLSRREEVELRKEQKKQQEEANLTFKPVLSTANHKSRTNDGKTEDTARYQRLYSDALKRHIQKTWKEKEEKEASFSPKLSTRPRSASRSSSASRASRDNNEIAERLHQGLGARGGGAAVVAAASRSRLEAELNKDLTFKPAITKRAKSMERKDSSKDASDRLYHHNQHLKEKLERKRQEVAARQLEGCTFAPAVNRKKDEKEPDADLHQRMQKFEETRRSHLERIAQE
eukprot:gene40259-49055_t